MKTIGALMVVSLLAMASACGAPSEAAEVHASAASGNPAYVGEWAAQRSGGCIETLGLSATAYTVELTCDLSDGTGNYYGTTEQGSVADLGNGTIRLAPVRGSCANAQPRSVAYRVSGGVLTMSWPTGAVSYGSATPINGGHTDSIGCFDSSGKFAYGPLYQF